MRKLLNSDTWLLTLLILAIVFLTSIPFMVGYAASNDQQQFMGIISNVADWTQYQAWMKAFETDIIIVNPLTSEAQTPAFVNAQWLALARLHTWTGLPDWIVVQIFRIVTTIAFLVVTFWVSKRYFPGRRLAYWTAWLLITFGAGGGWIWVLEKRMSGELKFPLDVYVVEQVTFQNATIYPHFLVGAGLILVILLSFTYSVQTKRLLPALAAALAGLLLGLTHAYDLLIVYGVLALLVPLMVLQGASIRTSIIHGAILLLFSAPPAAYFYYLTSVDPLWTRILEQFADVGVYTPQLPHLLILLGIPFVLAIIGYNGFFPLAQRGALQLLIRAWLLVNIVLLYIPADFQIHMLSGIQIPIGILASEALLDRFVPQLQRRFASEKTDDPSGGMPWFLRQNILVALVILLVIPTNLYLYAWRIKNVVVGHDGIYIAQDDMRAMEWLEANTQRTDIVFAPHSVGQYVPGTSGNHVYLGHWAQTVDFAKKRAVVEHFFSPDATDAERRTILEESGVDLLLEPATGNDERATGICEELELPVLFQQGNTTICQVSLATPGN